MFKKIDHSRETIASAFGDILSLSLHRHIFSFYSFSKARSRAMILMIGEGTTEY